MRSLRAQVKRAVRDALKGRCREEIDRAVTRTVRDVVFLFYLHQKVNEKLIGECEEYRYHALIW